MTAIYEIKDYNSWVPQTKNSLDLRLGIFTHEGYENAIIIIKSFEMKENLTALYTQASYLSLDGYKVLVENCPNLKILNLCCANKTGDTALKIISQLDKLEEINLHFARNEPIIEYMYGNSCRVLSDYIDQVERITDKGVARILDNCHNLRKLDLSGTQITNLTLEKIAQSKSIIYLRLHHCWMLKDSDIDNLAKARQDITIISNNKNDATTLFRQLARNVKNRYVKETHEEGGEFTPTFHNEISKEDKLLVSLSAFY